MVAIKVKLKNGEVKVGGNFQAALDWVKSHSGRDYDPVTKTWTVPLPIEKFLSYGSARFPIDIVSGVQGKPRFESGSHVTRYGNVYSGEEWDAQRSVWKAEKEIAGDYTDDYEASKKQFQADLQSSGVSVAGVRMLESRLWDFEDAEGYRLKFSSRARRDEVFAIVEARRERDAAIGKAEDNDLDAARERIFAGTGPY